MKKWKHDIIILSTGKENLVWWWSNTLKIEDIILNDDERSNIELECDDDLYNFV